jgi:hypothetical protein
VLVKGRGYSRPFFHGSRFQGLAWPWKHRDTDYFFLAAASFFLAIISLNLSRAAVCLSDAPAFPLGGTGLPLGGTALPLATGGFLAGMIITRLSSIF